jgi:hypothetical protein
MFLTGSSARSVIGATSLHHFDAGAPRVHRPALAPTDVQSASTLDCRIRELPKSERWCPI